MLPFGVTIPITVPQRLEIPEGLMNYPVSDPTFKYSELIEIKLVNTKTFCNCWSFWLIISWKPSNGFLNIILIRMFNSFTSGCKQTTFAVCCVSESTFRNVVFANAENLLTNETQDTALKFWTQYPSSHQIYYFLYIPVTKSLNTTFHTKTSRVARQFQRCNLYSGPSTLANSTFSLQPLLKGGCNPRV
jgi:hypothetical protein